MLLVNLFAIRLLSYAAGTLLCVFLLAILTRKHKHAAEDWLLTGLVAAGAVWHFTNGLQHYLVIAGREPARLISTLEATCLLASCLAPALFLHLSLLWTNLLRTAIRWGCLALYPVALAVWWSRPDGGPWLAGLAMAASAVALLYARRAAVLPYDRFYGWLALGLFALTAALLDSTLLAVASLAAPLCLLRFIYRFNLFDFLISRRVLFVFTLAGVSALYLLLVRALARWLEATTEAFGPLVEVTLVLGAVVTWLPMYAIITRFFSRQSKIDADFSKRVIEEAARILDLRPRAEYLVEQVGKTFGLRRAALILRDDPAWVAEYGPRTGTLAVEKLKELAVWLETGPHDLVHVKRLRRNEAARRILADSGFNYLFPLRYEDRLTGMLLADTAPRVFLEESETTLLGLSRQISLSIESCRLAESKIRLEKELLQQEHLATLGKVAATIAHEVKNPLSSIKTLAQLMREDPEVVERYDRDLDYMISETDRLNSCVQQLLTFARPLPGPGGEVALSELLESAASFLARESARQGVRIECRIAPDLKLVRADRQTVQQVVLNLLLNAIQASPSGSRVQLEAVREEDGRIRLRISDDGPGIPAEIREKIFEPFFTTKQQGTGLGLAIVRKNIRQLGGELELQTPLAGGRGTCVSVAFAENGGG